MDQTYSRAAYQATPWTTWRKSSFSGEGQTECVEIAPWGEVRDSKNPTGPTLRVDVRQFITAVKSGLLDR